MDQWERAVARSEDGLFVLCNAQPSIVYTIHLYKYYAYMILFMRDRWQKYQDMYYNDLYSLFPTGVARLRARQKRF